MEKLPLLYNYPLEDGTPFVVNTGNFECIGVLPALTPSANEVVEVYYLHKHSAGDILHSLRGDVWKPGQKQRIYTHEAFHWTNKPGEVPIRKEWLKSQQQSGMIPTIEEIKASQQAQLRGEH